MTELLKLPRALETDPRADAIREALLRDRAPGWSGGSVWLSRVALTPALVERLRYAQLDKALVRGLERIAMSLDAEELGLSAARAQDGLGEPERISRLLVLTADGSERFYRQCDRLLAKHARRTLGLVVDSTSSAFGARLFSDGAEAKAVLVSHRQSVARVLLALAPAVGSGSSKQT